MGAVLDVTRRTLILRRLLGMTLGVAAAGIAQAVDIAPGTNIQSVVNANSAGTTYVLKPGVHRLQAITPKNGDAFVGEASAILSGARLLNTFTKEGGLWVASGQTQQGPVTDPSGYSLCATGYDRCGNPEDFFINNVPLFHVTSLAQVGPGKYYFDYTADKIYFADDPTGKTVETGVLPGAFLGGATNVTLRGLIIEKYANPAQSGAVNYERHAAAWTIENNEIRLNHGGGIWTGSDFRILNNNVHHNGQMGVFGGGVRMVVEGNEIAYNNNLGFNWGWEAGGTKFVWTTGLVLRGNRVHHNQGPGLWTDGSNLNCLYETNQVYDNRGPGIFHEISHACIIRNNTLERNGLGEPGGLWYGGIGILISASEDTEVYSNTLRDNNGGIGLMQTNRGTSQRTGRAFEARNVYVHDNIITISQRTQGGVAGAGYEEMFTSWNNRFQNNTYYMGDLNGTYFAWPNDMNKDGWRAKGLDTTGKFLPIGEAPSPCDANGDGTLNVLDVQTSVNQALGVASCTDDINRDGKCNVLDVQRTVNAALGGPCLTN